MGQSPYRNLFWLLQLNLVFPNEVGQPMNHSNMVRRYFLKALEDAKIPKLRFHDLRHTYASLLIEERERIKHIQTQLGHSIPTVTLNVYAHLMKPTIQEAVQRLGKTAFQKDGSRQWPKQIFYRSQFGCKQKRGHRWESATP